MWHVADAVAMTFHSGATEDGLAREIDPRRGLPARPRRFGKSLMISTLKAMFQGRKDLFESLAIMDTDWDWEKEKRPVIHLNMGMCAAVDYDTFASALPGCVKRALVNAGAPYDSAKVPSENFGNAIDYLADKGTPPTRGA